MHFEYKNTENMISSGPSRLLDQMLWRMGFIPDRVSLWNNGESNKFTEALEWIGRKVITAILIIATCQGILFDIKSAYAQQPYTKGSSGVSAVYQNQRVMGSGETDVSRNNMGSVLLRSKSGRTTNQTFDMSHGSPIVWGRYLPEIGRGRIDVTYMEKNPVTGDVRLVEKIVGPQDFERTPIDKIPDNGLRKYYTNQAGVKFNPLYQFNSSYGGWGGGNNQLYDINFGAMTATMGMIAKRYNANRGYAMFGHFWQRESEGEECCCKVLGACICDRPWYQVDAGVNGEWHVLTSGDNASEAGVQSMYTIRGWDGGGTTPNATPTTRCVSDAGVYMSPVAPLDLSSADHNPIGGFDELGLSTKANEADRDNCLVRGSMNILPPNTGADFNKGQYHFWQHRKYYSCGMPFILVVIIAVIATIVTFGAAAALMGPAVTAAAISTMGAAGAALGGGLLGASVAAGLIAGALMTAAHLINGGGLTEPIALDQAGMMILGAAIGGAIGGSGIMGTIASSMSEAAGYSSTASTAIGTTADTSLIAGQTAGNAVDAVRAASALNMTSEAVMTATNTNITLTFVSEGATMGSIGLMETGTSIASAFASDPTSIEAQRANQFAQSMLTGMGMSEAAAAAAAPGLPTNTVALTYGKYTPSGPTGDEFDFRSEVASCFMDPAITSSSTAGANNGCRGSSAATWSTYSSNRQCDPAAATGSSTSCASRFSQYSDVVMMKMGASISTDSQIINNDYTTTTALPLADEPIIYLPKATGGRPRMIPWSKANNPTGAVQ